MTPQTDAEERAPNGVYAAFWRWHFYAGLLVMPVLMLMALTGGLYLFKDEIEGVLNRPMLQVPASAVSKAPQEWADAGLRAYPGELLQVMTPGDDRQSARLLIAQANGEQQTVFVNPHDGRVLGAVADGGPMQVVRRIHSLDIAGPVFNLMVELVAGWAIVMAATGVVLWWPRNPGGGVVTIRARPASRLFWRDLHAVTGVFAGAVIVFLAATGMPWSAVWGKEVRRITTEAGWGRPAAPSSVGVSTHAAHGAPPAVPWALQDADIRSGHRMGRPPPVLTLDAAVSAADAAGLSRPYALSLPNRPGAPWSASYMPAKVERMRTVYLDSGDGRLLADIGYSDFGAAAKAIEWGIAVHQGQQFGLANKLVMLAGCVAIWILGASALVMWWMRRPKGRIAAPPKPLTRGGYVWLAAVVAPLGLIYPLVGGSLVLVIAADLLFQPSASRKRDLGAD